MVLKLPAQSKGGWGGGGGGGGVMVSSKIVTTLIQLFVVFLLMGEIFPWPPLPRISLTDPTYNYFFNPDSYSVDMCDTVYFVGVYIWLI